MEIVDNLKCLGRHTTEPYEDHMKTIQYPHMPKINHVYCFLVLWLNLLRKHKYHVGKHARDFNFCALVALENQLIQLMFIRSISKSKDKKQSLLWG